MGRETKIAAAAVGYGILVLLFTIPKLLDESLFAGSESFHLAGANGILTTFAGGFVRFLGPLLVARTAIAILLLVGGLGLVLWPGRLSSVLKAGLILESAWVILRTVFQWSFLAAKPFVAATGEPSTPSGAIAVAVFTTVLSAAVLLGAGAALAVLRDDARDGDLA